MSKKIYDLSIQNQMTEDRRILKAESGQEYDVSFRPAILNRKYYKRWQGLQAEIMKGIKSFVMIKQKLEETQEISKEDEDNVKAFQALAEEAAGVGADLVIYAIQNNGYPDFNEDTLYSNFSEAGISLAINFIMGIDQKEEIKKKAPHKRRR